MKEHLKRTAKNKITALLLVAVGLFLFLIGKDATALVFLTLIAVPLFFANKDYILEVEK